MIAVVAGANVTVELCSYCCDSEDCSDTIATLLVISYNQTSLKRVREPKTSPVIPPFNSQFHA